MDKRLSIVMHGLQYISKVNTDKNNKLIIEDCIERLNSYINTNLVNNLSEIKEKESKKLRSSFN